MQDIRPKAILSWMLWTAWTILLCFLLLSPSEGTAVRDISMFFGGTELTDAIGHVGLIFIKTALLYNALHYYISVQDALRTAVIASLIFGICAELAQIWIPSRGASIVDVLAAFIGVSTFYVIQRRRQKI